MAFVSGMSRRMARVGACAAVVLAVRPDDEVAKRARELAVRYEGTDRDLLYRIFVKYLKFR